MTMFKNYILDLDGTILNSEKEVLKCFDYAFKKANIDIPKNRLTPDIIGPPLKDIVLNIAQGDCTLNQINEIIENYENIYDFDNEDISTIYDDMDSVLKILKCNSNNIFLATFKPLRPTLRIIKQFEIDVFSKIYSIDSKCYFYTDKSDMLSDIIKDNCINKNETVMIGDAPTDIIAAKNNGITSIGVLWGYGTDKTELIKQSDFIVKDARELLQCLKLNSRII